MLVNVAQLVRVGRFQRWDTTTATRAGSKLARLTLIFGRNASGKSTLVRALRAAAAGSADQILLDKTIDATQPPAVKLELTDGPYTFDGTAWKGTPPTIHIFDRKFIEDNVFVGTLSSKRHRTQILQIALGADEVSLAVTVDQLSKRGRELAHEQNPHDKLLRATFAKHGMLESTFVALPPVDDVDAERAELDVRGHDAAIQRELARRAQPTLVPAIPRLDFGVIAKLLETTATEVAAEVRAHLDKRLGGNGEAWVREGMEFADGKTCPFCGQSVAKKGGDLIEAFAEHFDRAYVDLTGAIDLALTAARSIATWWQAVEKVLEANDRAFDAWELDAIALPAREADATAIGKKLITQLEAKRKQPTKPIANTAVDDARAAYDKLAATVADYNKKLEAARAAIGKRLAQAGGGSAAAAIAAERKKLDATVDRYSEPITHALAERDRLVKAIAEIDTAKKRAVEEMHEKKLAQLEQFTARINELLGLLCADFTIEELETERSGGTTGARFTVRLPAGKLSVATSNDETKFARVLSDGDRSTLALAVFLISIERAPDLEHSIVVFDDPMTSQDAQRSEATAEQLTRLARKANQVIVVSHLASFLLQVAYDWRRHGGEAKSIAELELDRSAMTLRPWSADDHATDEHVRRAAELRAFATDPASDAFAPRMHGEIRKFLEHHIKSTRAALNVTNLEALVRKLRGDAELLATAKWTTEDLEELDRLTAFTARAGTGVAPEPEVIRGMARRALAFADQ
ncbi:MAG: AAA family ATPase [Kofleriaceae bacterium]